MVPRPCLFNLSRIQFVICQVDGDVSNVKKKKKRELPVNWHLLFVILGGICQLRIVMLSWKLKI